jgi:proteasome lid subunit RPN8/RPN11
MVSCEFQASLTTITVLVKAGKEEALAGYLKSLEGLEREIANVHHDFLWQFRKLEYEIDNMPKVARPSVPTYVVGSLFLEHCKSQLTIDENEDLFYVTGIERDNYIYLTTLVKFECSQRSVVGVYGDHDSVFKAVMKLHRAGHRLYAWFHSHPGSRDACSPSDIDLGMQRRLETVQYPAIGGIFSHDGFLRFFSVERQFQVQIHGEGIEDVDPEKYLYRIDL